MKHHPSASAAEAGTTVVPLGVEIVAEPTAPASRPNRLHALGTAGMTLCAFVGIASMMALIGVRWSVGTGRIVIGILIGSIIGFLCFASIAVSAAMRDTYARAPRVETSKGAGTLHE